MSSSSSSLLLRAGVAALWCVGGAVGKLSSRTIDLCTSYTKVCDSLTSKVDCATHYDSFPSHRVVSSMACQGLTYDTYVGQCTCAALDASTAVLHELVDYSIEKGVDTYLVAGSGYEMEACGTFENVCNTFLGGIKCPSALRLSTGCSTAKDLSTFKGECLCGSVDLSSVITEVMVTNRISPDLTLTPATGGAKTNLCSSFSSACTDLLEDVGCSSALSTNTGCSTTNSTASLDGVCKCGTLDASAAISTTLARSLIQDSFSSSLTPAKESELSLDFCTSYSNLCSAFLTQANCPSSSQASSSGCVGGSGTNLATFRPSCTCGSLDVSSVITNLLIEGQIAEDIPELVCVGDGCAPGSLTAGAIAMIIISIVLVAILVLTFLYIRGEPLVRRLLVHPFWRRLGAFSPFHKPWPMKSSPTTNDHHDPPAHA